MHSQALSENSALGGRQMGLGPRIAGDYHRPMETVSIREIRHCGRGGASVRSVER
jgi:hypothetical protein